MSNDSFRYVERLVHGTDAPIRSGHHVQHQGFATVDGETCATTDFDYAKVDHDLHLDPPPLPRDIAYHKAGDMLCRLVLWLSESKSVNAMGRRALALIWVLRPCSFDDRTLHDLARRFHITRQSVLKYTSQIHHMSHGIYTSPYMRSPASRVSRRKLTTDYHRRIGHEMHGK